MSNKEDREKKGETALKEREEVRKPRLFKVIIHNDDYTTQEFVVELLMVLFAKTHEQAKALMLFVHHNGSAVAGIYPHDIAATKVDEGVAFARASGHPLHLSMEPE